MKVTLHPEARPELLAAVRNYDEEVAGLGEKFLQSVANSIGRIRSFPESYPYVLTHYRRAGVRRFPYGIVYQVEGNSLTIVAIMHNRRSPDYFLERLK